VAPDDVAGLARAMQRMIDDPSWWEQCSQAGIRRAAGFTWEQCAATTAAVLVEAAAGVPSA